MRLLAGLGNPVKEGYATTRHNLGFLAVDAVARELGITTWKEHKKQFEIASTEIGGEKVLLFKSLGHMNKSGEPLRAALDYYKIEPEDLCIIADDVYVAPGSARIRQSGGDGGHNGWKSVHEHLDSDHFWRVKIGAGLYEQHPEKRMHQPPLDEYVVQPMPAHEQKATEQLIDKLVPNLINWLGSGLLEEETIHL